MAECTTTPPINPCVLPEIPDSGITTEAVTEGCVGGSGVFDQFMQVTAANLEQEYKRNRITGPEYSQVYLGTMQAVMAQSIQFILNKDKAAAEAELARYQMFKTAAETALVDAQRCKVENEIELVKAQKALTYVQMWSEIAKVDDHIHDRMDEILDDDFHGPVIVTEHSVFGSQVDKTQAERDLINQKKVTEYAQTHDWQPGTETPVKGVIGKERNLLQRQADGFLRDAEAKMAKVATDAFAVQFSTLDGVDYGGSGVWTAENLSAIVENAAGNVGNASSTDGDIEERGTP